MKKIFYIIICFCSFSALFAQNYEELLSKGKKYEDNNEFVYALGYYYDAICSENAGDEANLRFDSLKTVIESGNPGHGDFSTITMQKGWIALMKNYYKYFTEFCPYDIYFSDSLEIGKIDYNTETAEYLLPYVYVPSEKYQTIKDILMKGIAINSRDDWGSLKSGIVPYAKLEAPSSVEAANIEFKKIYTEEKIALSGKFYVKYGQSLFKHSLSSESVYSLVTYSGPYSWAILDDQGFTMYDIQFDIYDENNKLLLSGQRQNCGKCVNEFNNKTYSKLEKDSKYTFIDKGAKLLGQIEKKSKLIIKPTAVFLNYGCLPNKIDTELYWGEERVWNRQIFTSLLDIPIKLENVSFMDDFQIQKRKEIAEQQKIKQQRVEQERLEKERQEKLRIENEEKQHRLIMFQKTGELTPIYAFEILSNITEDYPKVVKISGNIEDNWELIKNGLSCYNSPDFVLDLSEVNDLKSISAINCKSIIEIILPKNLIKIGEKSFVDCPNLNTITIPNSLSLVEDSAFENCNNLKTVNYLGSQKEWKKIEIGKKNNPLKKAKINYIGK